jgi:membrane-bound lytic murein transglycosylase D
MKIKYLLFLTLLSCITLSQASVFYPENDTVTDFTDDTATVFSADMVADDLENNYVLDMLDSLVAAKFFSNNEFTDDTSILNVYNFPPDSIPVYNDSILSERIAHLNQHSIVELVFNRHVKTYINVYSVKRRELASKVLGLSEVYFPLFEEYLDKYNMPLELKYLAVVESALNPTANSRAGAKGLWQFMYRTGRVYGLKANSLVDDRFDPYKATDAACRHLQDLYDIYGNWSLALAAYNSGAGNVNKAIRRAGGVKSYWAVWPYLPRETRGYVPAFIAVMYIMNYTAEHNIYPIQPNVFYNEIDTVVVNDVLSFDQISEMLNIPIDELKFLNPAYKTGIIPSTADNKYILRLHHQYIASFIDNEKALYAYKTKKGIEKEKLLAEIKKAKERNIHVVRYGENLGLIAQKYRCSVRNLKSWNNLRKNTIYPGQKLVIYAPGYTGQKVTSASKSSSAAAKSTDISNRNRNYHIVKNGENLGLIAQKYKCSVNELKRWNNLTGNTIQPKQKLLVYEPEKANTTQEISFDNNITGKYVYHTVKKGDTLWDIAKLYKGVTVDQIRKLNNIQNSKKLKPGQKLKVSVKG